jgi:hypothetical protein
VFAAAPKNRGTARLRRMIGFVLGAPSTAGRSATTAERTLLFDITIFLYYASRSAAATSENTGLTSPAARRIYTAYMAPSHARHCPSVAPENMYNGGPRVVCAVVKCQGEERE